MQETSIFNNTTKDNNSINYKYIETQNTVYMCVLGIEDYITSKNLNAEEFRKSNNAKKTISAICDNKEIFDGLTREDSLYYIGELLKNE